MDGLVPDIDNSYNALKRTVMHVFWSTLKRHHLVFLHIKKTIKLSTTTIGDNIVHKEITFIS